MHDQNLIRTTQVLPGLRALATFNMSLGSATTSNKQPTACNQLSQLVSVRAKRLP